MQDLEPDERRRIRQIKARPVADALGKWLQLQRQKVPDGSRFVQFNLETFDAGFSWSLNSVQIHREDKVGSSIKVSDSYLTLPKDAVGLPLVETRSSAAFIFVPPAQSRVLASQRTVKF